MAPAGAVRLPRRSTPGVDGLPRWSYKNTTRDMSLAGRLRAGDLGALHLARRRLRRDGLLPSINKDFVRDGRGPTGLARDPEDLFAGRRREEALTLPRARRHS